MNILASRRAKRDILTRLEGIEDPTARRMLELHSPDRRQECKGCDPGAFAQTGADWPCQTVELIADIHGATIPQAA